MPGWNMGLEIIAFHPNSEASTVPFPPRAFSSEVDAGSREENASK
jgi:hypothetical protein